MGQIIRVGHSPDPDDAFMFYALAQEKIPCDGFEIEHVIEDIESLNQRAFRAELEVTALSCHAFGFLSDRYQLIPYGASIGENYGPVVIASPEGAKQSHGLGTGFAISEIASVASLPRNDGRSRIRGSRIAVPGRYTTAYLVLQLYESDFRPLFVSFEKIFETLEKGEADLGLLIHEGQLTYQEMGFQKVVDLGEWWHDEYKLPLPLGINAIRKDLDRAVKEKFAGLFLRSIKFAMTHRKEAMEYALKFGRGIDTSRADRFVDMYVNDYSLELGHRGIHSLQTLFELGHKRKLLPVSPEFEVIYPPQSKKSRIMKLTGLV